jgi:hypothetical protein
MYNNDAKMERKMNGNDPFQTPEYRQIQEEHLYRSIAYMLERGIEFAVAAEVEYMAFDPELPAEIYERFSPVSLFVLSGYTYETSRLEEGLLSFEAGFGEGDFGSQVTLPLLAIKQLIVGEYPIAINIAEPSPLEEESPDTSRSMEALLNNPENLRLLKKRKKQ